MRAPVQHLAQLLTSLQSAVAAGDDRLAETVAWPRSRSPASGSTPGPVRPAQPRSRPAASKTPAGPCSPPTSPTRLLGEYCRCLATPGGLPLLPDDVTAELDAWLHQPLRHAVQLAETRGWDHTEASPYVLEVTGRLGNPADAAANLLAGSATGPSPSTPPPPGGHRGIAIWVPPDLYIIKIQRQKQIWEHYSNPTIDPILASWTAGERGRYRQLHGATRNPIRDATDWLSTLNIHL